MTIPTREEVCTYDGDWIRLRTRRRVRIQTTSESKAVPAEPDPTAKVSADAEQLLETQANEGHFASEITMADKLIFITASRRLGKSSLATRSGDGIYLIAGTRTPFILREVPSSSSSLRNQGRKSHRRTFRLISPAYVHGAMFGEATNHSQTHGLETVELV